MAKSTPTPPTGTKGAQVLGDVQLPEGFVPPPRVATRVRPAGALVPVPRGAAPSESTARRILHERSGGLCELCTTARATDWAHRLDRSHGGQWRPANGLHLCHRCHAWHHAHPGLAGAGGWRLVRDPRDPADVPVWLSRPWPSWWLLDDDGVLIPVDHVEAGLPVAPVLPGWVTGT